ncbi:MAG: VacJ family lipoprotein [Deltaproteobacteria bacterium]|nr:VacJ family lipoprotein [Deltaproteobacteria bacterium]
MACLFFFVNLEFARGEGEAGYGGVIRTAETSAEPEEFEEDFYYVEEGLADPLEPVNRVFFVFNDRLYFWLLKPVATGYKRVVPEKARVGLKNFFTNLAFPLRFVNCLLQAKGKGALEELESFVLNSIGGMAGFFDIAGAAGVRKYDEDLDQSLAVFGLGPGFYINWPLFGPSTLRATFGSVGEAFLDPVHYLDSSGARFVFKSSDLVNSTSLHIGDYESLKRAALDPYVALRDAYYQNRLKKIQE